MRYRVAISTSSFAELDKAPIDILQNANVEVVTNPYKRKLTEKEITNHLDGIDGLIAGLELLNRNVLESSPSLKAIARVGIGLDNVDLKAAEELNIKVSNTPDAPSKSVAELCITALLTLSRQILFSNEEMHNGIWKKRIGFSLEGVNVLLIGYGRIGRRFADILRFFNSKILVVDPGLSQGDLKNREQLVHLDNGLKEADVISLHANGIETIISKNEFKKMKKGVYLLNSARGELVDERALVDALDGGIVTAAWLDVFNPEPYSGPLTNFSQVLMTPHISTYTRQCRNIMETEAVKNLLRDLKI